MADQPGNGYSSPFGNGAGNVGGPSAPSGSPPRDFTSMVYQQGKMPPGGMANPDSIPPGGRMPTAQMDPPASRAGNAVVAGNQQRKPFVLQGVASVPSVGPSDLPGTSNPGEDIPAEVSVPLCNR